MKQYVIATRNDGKVREFSELLAHEDVKLVSLDQMGVEPEFDIEETGETFEANARLKAEGFGRKTHLSTIADDSGLIIDALDGRPGVFSKRYGNSDQERCLKILGELKKFPEIHQRTARFVSVVCVYNPENGRTYCEEGRVEGYIALAIKGSHGFGYDPVFVPHEGNGRTFAELGSKFKNTVSHRARAIAKLKLSY